MNTFLKKFSGLLLVLLLAIPALAQNTYPHIVGDHKDKSKVFDASYLQTLENKLAKLETESGYALYVEINEAYPAKKFVKKGEDGLNDFKEDRRLDRIKSFKNLKVQKTKLGKGVVVHLDFINWPVLGTEGDVDVFYMNTISLGPLLSSYAKTKFAALKPQGKLEQGTDKTTQNATYIDALIGTITGIFDEDKTQPQDNYLFGDLVVKIENPTKGKGSKTVNGVDLDLYTSSKASFDLPFRSGLNRLSAKIPSAGIEYYYNPSTGNYSDVKITYKSNNDSIFAGKLLILNCYAKNVNVTIDNLGKLSGNLDVSSYVDRDLELENIIVLKKGLAGLYKFNYIPNTTKFEGSFDFSGLKGLELIAIKDKEQIASLKGSISADGTINGVLQNTDKVTIHEPGFDLILETFKMDLSYSFKSGLKLNSGAFEGVFTKIPSISGDLRITGSYDNAGNLKASIDQTKTNIYMYGMHVENMKLGVELDSTLSLAAIEGSFFAKHPDFNTSIGISSFKWSAKNGLESFSGNGSVQYKGFFFDITKLEGSEGALICDARVELNTTGVTAYAAVSEFTLTDDGEVSIGGIEGTINKFPFNLTFAAEFQESRFSGYFKGQMSKIEIEGTIDVGQKVNGNTKFTFCYLKLVVSGPGVPLTPFPIKIKSLGGEVGANYYIDFEHKKTGGIGPGEPKLGNYLAGLTLEVTDVTEMISVTGNPIIQISGSSLDLHMNGQVKIPREEPWFSLNVEANYQLPSQRVFGAFNYNFKLPQNSGVLIEANNLGFDFSFDQTKWYVGRKGMELKLFRALDMKSSAEFSGNYTNLSAFTADLEATMDLNYSWSGHKTIKVFDYDALDASASIRFLFHTGASLHINKAGIAGSFDAKMQADGNINLNVCPSCNYSWTQVDVGVNVDIGGKFEFQNTKLHMQGNANLAATICSYTGRFDFGIDYTFDPTQNGSGTYTSTTSTSVQQSPTQPKPYVVSTAMPKPGGASTYMAQYQADKAEASSSSPLLKYPTIRKNLPEVKSLLGNTDYTSFEAKLKKCSAYVLGALNKESSDLLAAFARYIKANPTAETDFKTNNTAFDTWLTTAKANLVIELTAQDLPDDVVADDKGANELAYSAKAVVTDVVDIIIHANGSSYKFVVNGTTITADHRTLAGWIKSKGYNTKKLRLLSCSSLESAQNLANKLNQTVIATDGFVRIYSDGGITAVDGSGAIQSWYELKPGNVKTSTSSPRAPGNGVTDYVQMGGSTSSANFPGAITLTDLVVYDPFKGGANASFAQKTIEIYNNAVKTNKIEDWTYLEAYFRDNKLNEFDGRYWPPMNGGFNTKKNQKFKPGDVFDRYQRITGDALSKLKHGQEYTLSEIIAGTFTSPVYNDNQYNYEQRAIAGNREDYHLFYKIIIKEALPFDYELANVIPWHGWAGGGIQAWFNMYQKAKWADLINDGKVEIEIISSPNGSFRLMPNGNLKFL